MQFTRLTLDGAAYMTLGTDVVLAARLLPPPAGRGQAVPDLGAGAVAVQAVHGIKRTIRIIGAERFLVCPLVPNFQQFADDAGPAH